MAATRRTADACVGDLLLNEPNRWDFYQAVRLWEQGASAHAAIGEGDDPTREALRFTTAVSFAFPTCEVAALDLDPERPGQATMRVTFLGAATPASFGSLPMPYAEDVALADRDRLPALHEFIDLFNHRFIALFYRAWQKHRAAVGWERAGEGDTALFETALRSLFGLAARGARAAVPIPDAVLLGRGGLLRPGRTSCASLVELIGQVFGVPARVEQFITRWFALELEDRSRLGEVGHRLGHDVTLGDRVPLAQSRFRLVLGPLDWQAFDAFLPAGGAHKALHDLVQFAVGSQLTYDVQLDLDADGVPPLRLGLAADRPPACLGWTTWLGDVAGRTAAHVVVAGPAAA